MGIWENQTEKTLTLTKLEITFKGVTRLNQDGGL